GGGRIGWAEDATHDVFVKLLESLPELDDPQDLGGWLYRVACNLCVSRLRREQSLFGRVKAALLDQSETETDLVEIEDRTEARAALEALGSLPGKERVVLCMKVLDGKSQREIAELLSLSEGYVSKLVTRAWAKLKAAGWDGDVEA